MDSKALSVPSRTFVLFLAFIVCLFLIFPQPAGAVEPVAWIAASALAGVIAGAAGSGINIAVNGIAEDVGTMSTDDVRELWHDLLSSYAFARGIDLLTSFPSSGVTIGTAGTILLSSSFAKNVKDFINWLQSDKGVVSTGSPVTLSSLITSSGTINLQPLIPLVTQTPIVEHALLLVESGDDSNFSRAYVYYEDAQTMLPDDVPFYSFILNDGVNAPKVVFASTINWYPTYVIRGLTWRKGHGQGTHNIGYRYYSQDSFSNLYYTQDFDLTNFPNYVSVLPEFSSIREGLDSISYPDSIERSLVATPGVVRIPDVIDEVPVPIYVPGLPLTLPDAASYIIDNSAIGDLEASYTADVTLESQLPAPVVQDPQFFSFALPSFDFGFDGIWDYVVDWVASLGSSLSLFFTIWRGLPYAMIVPVYASAVIVIVIGMYRRFFV